MQLTVILIFIVSVLFLCFYKNATANEIKKQIALLQNMKSQIINEHRVIDNQEIKLSYVFSKELREKFNEYMSMISFLTLEEAANGISEIYQSATNESENRKAELDITSRAYTIILSLCTLIAIVVLI